jgi:hypothetical protein
LSWSSISISLTLMQRYEKYLKPPNISRTFFQTFFLSHLRAPPRPSPFTGG